MKFRGTLLLCVVVGVIGCSGDDGDYGENGFSSLIEQVQLNEGNSQCQLGGLQINSGLDQNRNNDLDTDEVTSSETICSGSHFQLQLLHFADVDGGRDIINNAPRFSAILDTFRREYPNTLVLSSGDNWIPGPEYNVASDSALTGVLGVAGSGRAHVAYLNALGVQASAFGNHEFDLGTDDIASLINTETDEAGTWQGADFPYLAANLDFSTDSNLAPLTGPDGSSNQSLRNKIAGSTVISAGGQSIGVVGATTPTLNSISSPGDTTIKPAAGGNTALLAEEIQTAVDQLTQAGINKIILLAHMQQIIIERELATLLRDVDIIVAGGSNTILADSNDRLRDGDSAVDVYPLNLTSASGEPVLVVNTDGDFTYLGRLVVQFDAAGQVIPESLNDQINGAYATDENGLIENNLAISEAIPEVQNISDALNTALSARAGNVFGSTSTYLNGERVSVRTEETNLGTLTAEANLVYAQQTDPSVAFSIKNGGGIRAPIGFCNVPPGATGDDQLVCNPPAGIEGINQSGEISQLDLEIALRFNNSLTLLTLTGAELATVIEHGVAATADGATPGQFPQVAGLRFSFDPSLPAGSRVQNLVVLDDNGAEAGGNTVVVVGNGELSPTAASQNFRMVTLGFLAEGGDQYPFPAGPAAAVFDLEMEGVQTGSQTFVDDGTEQDALAEYLSANFPADQDAATPSYNVQDIPASNDQNIQNLAVIAEDTVLIQ